MVIDMNIYHTINSGLIFSWKDTAILVDVLHGKVNGFSDIPDPLRNQVRSGTGPVMQSNGLIFTHKHADHYDADLVSEFLSKRPGIPLLTPGFYINCQPKYGHDIIDRCFQIGPIDVIAVSTSHDGVIYSDVNHESYLIGVGEDYILVAGDAALDQEECVRIMDVKKPACGFFNVYQLARPTVQQMIRTVHMKNVYLYHLGYEEDDEFQYHKLAKRVINRFPDDLPTPELIKPMEYIK